MHIYYIYANFICTHYYIGGTTTTIFHIVTIDILPTYLLKVISTYLNLVHIYYNLAYIF